MVLDAPRHGRCATAELPDPEPGPGQVLLRVRACGGLPHRPAHRRRRARPMPKLPLVLGHQIVGRVVGGRRALRGWATASACPGSAGPAASAATAARAARTSATARASPATTSTAATPSCAVADERFCFPLPDGYADLQAAPLLCAGLIGYRALRLAGDARAARPLRLRRRGAHRRAGRARSRAGACSRSRAPGDDAGAGVRARAGRRVGGRRDERRPPEELDAAIIFAPVGELVPAALRGAREGRRGRLRGHPHERHPVVPLRAALGRARAALGGEPHARATARSSSRSRRRCRCARRSRRYPLERANEALDRLRSGHIRGAAAILPGKPLGATE